MSIYTPTQPEFKIEHRGKPSQTLIIGLSDLGIAGLTAVDYLSEHLELNEIGHITSEDLPSITPFENGRPRHHTRLFSRDDLDLTILVGELFIPIWAADSFSREILNWTIENEVEEIVILSGVPIAHGPEGHDVFYVATDDYREKHLENSKIKPMGGGFLEGVHASLISQGIDSPLAVNVFVTPVHPPRQDIEASLRLLDAVKTVYGLDIDTQPLKKYAKELEDHYNELAERIQRMEKSREGITPSDRTFV